MREKAGVPVYRALYTSRYGRAKHFEQGKENGERCILPYPQRSSALLLDSSYLNGIVP
jgi:predicted adenine nucleotide alpha hydrolase (AANH) superfamily ATPase